MSLHISEINGNTIAEIISEEIQIRNTQDAVDILGNCLYQGARKLIIRKSQITPEFFDLKTGIAGDILQKFSNYGMKLAIVGDFSMHPSLSLRDFIRESNRTGNTYFVHSSEEARNMLAR